VKRTLLLLALVASLVVGHQPRPLAQPRTQPSTQPAVPRRIASLVPATTEMLFAIGAGSRVVGVGSYDRYPPDVETLPKLGGLLDPSIERLLALRPDLVIVYDSQAELRRQLDRAHLPVWVYSMRGLPEITSTMRALGGRIGMAAEANGTAADIEARLRAIQGRVAGRPRPRTLLVFGREPGSLRGINASGGYGFLHDLLELAGGVDVLGDVRQAAVAMSSETVLARAPEAIIELHYGDSIGSTQLDDERRVWDSLQAVPAVRARRVYLMTGNEFVVPGPRVVQAAERFARALHPEAFR
jgi:iron complex transport system substrate-binding protein